MNTPLRNRATRWWCAVACATAVVSYHAAGQCPGAWLSAAGSPGVNRFVTAMTWWDPDGAGPLPPRLAVGGDFTSAGALAAARVAVYDPATNAWSALGAGVTGTPHPFVFAISTLTNGDLVAGGYFTAADGQPADYIARWDGASWHALGAGLDGYVNAICPAPGGGLVAGGVFTHAGGAPAPSVARWDGSSWSPVGGGTDGVVFALAVTPAGDVIAGGSFANAGGVPASGIARWDGTAWSALGAGLDGPVSALAVLASGDVVAGGTFQNAGTTPASHIARWDGSAWWPLDAGTDNAVLSLAASDGDVYAAGQFLSAGGVPAAHIARWDGASWHALDAGVDGDVRTVASAPGARVFVGGFFSHAGAAAAGRIAEWGPAGAPVFSSQPADASVCPASGAVFEAAFAAPPPVPMGLRWQWKSAAQPGWTDVVEGDNPAGPSAVFNALGAASPSLAVNPPLASGTGTFLAADIAGLTLRCVAASACGDTASDEAVLTLVEPCCDTIDFNGDGLFPDTEDILDYLRVFSGGACSNEPLCGDIDFNNDGLFPDTTDLDSLLSVFGGGACT